MDLTIYCAKLPDRTGLWDIGIAQGRIAELVPSSSPVAPAFSASQTFPINQTFSANQTLTANGHLVIPGLIDPHFHLDKALLLDRAPAQEGSFAEAMQETLRLKRTFTVEDIQVRARRVLEGAIAFGITAMRSHVEVDPSLGLTALEALLPLRSEYAWGITLQLAVFAQEGITNHPGSVELLRQAMQQGDVIGSAPYVDPDPQRNVQIVFEIAEEFNCDVDFHLDYLDDDEPLLLPFVIAETVKRGWQGRVCVGHVTKLAGLTPKQLAAIASQIRSAGISVLALPASDLYIMARKDTHNVRRGVAPLHHLAHFGVNVGLATNNIQNLFTPFGDGDVLKICTLLAQVLQMGTTASHELCLRMATTQAAEAIGLKSYGLAVGQVADLVLLDATSVSEAIGTAPIARTVIKHGKVVSVSQRQQRFWPDQHD
jgi:cytosine/creatinine deaminase